MAEVLSQSQIDALLAAAQSGQMDLDAPAEEAVEKKYRKYDFYSPRKFTKDRIRMLNSIFENYTRVINSRLNALLHSTCEIEVDSVEEQRYHEFSNALRESDVLALVKTDHEEYQEETPILLHLDTTVLLTILDRMMGGDGDPDDAIDSEYNLTDLELKIYSDVIEDLVSVLGRSWENYMSINFEYVRTEVNPTLVQLIGLEETVVIVDMKVSFPNIEGSISIVMPEDVLSSIFTEIRAGNPSKKANSEEHQEEIFDHLRDSTLEIRAELARTTLRLDDVYRLNIGDVIDLNRKKDSELNLYVGGQRWFNGLMGVSDKRLAIKIKEVYHNAGGRGRLQNEQ